MLALVLMKNSELDPLEVVPDLMGLPIILLQFLTVYAAKCLDLPS